MKLFSSSSFYNPLYIEASGKPRQLQRIFIFGDSGVILETHSGWFTNGTGSNSAKKTVIFSYDNPIKLKKVLNLEKEKVFTIKTTYEYATYKYGNNPFTVDLYIHNDVAKFEKSKYILTYNSVEAVYNSYAGVTIHRTVDKLDKKSSALQSKIWTTKKEIAEAHQNEVYQKLGSKLARQCRAHTKAKEAEKELRAKAKIFFNIQ
jgi:hypothetical protein